jgi:hypothetical protein
VVAELSVEAAAAMEATAVAPITTEGAAAAVAAEEPTDEWRK